MLKQPSTGRSRPKLNTRPNASPLEPQASPLETPSLTALEVLVAERLAEALGRRLDGAPQQKQRLGDERLAQGAALVLRIVDGVAAQTIADLTPDTYLQLVLLRAGCVCGAQALAERGRRRERAP